MADTDYSNWLKGMGITDNVYSTYNPQEQIGLAQSFANLQKPESQGILGNTMDFLKSDSMKGVSTIGGLGLGAFNIWNSMNAQDQAKKQWAAENARADKILGMNTERYEQWKADKNRLNSQYA